MIKLISTFLLVTLLLITNTSTGNGMQAVGQGDRSDDCPSRYVVRSGDTLRIIAKRCKTTVAKLLNNNPAIENANRIYVGQVIQLSSREAIPVTGTEANAQTSSAETIGQTGEASRTIYKVKRGDSLARIARQLETSLDVLLLANPAVKNPNLIYVNQELYVPNHSDLQALREERMLLEAKQQQAVVDVVGMENERWIDVDLANQKVRAYQGRELVETFTVSTGTWRTPTVTGQYKIWIKLALDDMRGPGYYLRDVPYVMYFYKGYGLHGTYWHSNFGTPMSHGCVNLSIDDAAWLYEFAEVGTLVNIH
jgi:lipoprotein-anchoring transpeptidase ErfK/SrfK